MTVLEQSRKVGTRFKVRQQKSGCMVRSGRKHYRAKIGTVSKDDILSQKGSGKVLIKERMG